MATIDITRTHALGLEEAKTRASQLADDLREKLNVEWSWDGDDIRFKAGGGPAKGTRGKLSVAGDSVRVEIDLPLLLRAMKGQVSDRVEKRLDQVLA